MPHNKIISRVGIVIVTHNRKRELSDTLASIAAQTYPIGHLKVVVSDNNSTDGSRENIKGWVESMGWDWIVHNPEIGFAAAANKGIEFLDVTYRPDFFMVLTDDVWLQYGCVSQLVRAMEIHHDIAIAGPRIIDRKTLALDNSGSYYHKLFGHSFPHKTEWAEITDVDFVQGCCMMARAEGIFREEFFNSKLAFYSEDADICFWARTLKIGRVCVVPQATAEHVVDGTMRKNRSKQLRYSTRNNLFVLVEHGIGYYPLSLIVYLLAVCPYKVLHFMFKAQPKNSLGIVRGMIDWVRGKYGLID